MDLSVSPVKISASNHNGTGKLSFGMAKFTDNGLKYAESLGDVYTPFADPTEFQDSSFYKKKSFFAKAPFARYMDKTISKGAANPENAEKVAQTIVECGATKNSFSNARFIKQMLTTKSQLDKMRPETRTVIKRAAESVLAVNWNNPELSKDETKALARYAFDENTDEGRRALSSLDGVIDNSDAITPKTRKRK